MLFKGVGVFQYHYVLNEYAVFEHVQDVDIVMAPVMLSYQRKAYTDFSYPLSFDAYKIAYPWPKQASRLLAPLWPYQNVVRKFIFKEILLSLRTLDTST